MDWIGAPTKRPSRMHGVGGPRSNSLDFRQPFACPQHRAATPRDAIDGAQLMAIKLSQKPRVAGAAQFCWGRSGPVPKHPPRPNPSPRPPRPRPPTRPCEKSQLERKTAARRKWRCQRRVGSDNASRSTRRCYYGLAIAGLVTAKGIVRARLEAKALWLMSGAFAQRS